MNNYQKVARDKVLKDITIKCAECKIDMIAVVDLWDETIVGYSCPDCFRAFMYSVTTDSV